jgi:hypothetical protein
VAQSFGEAEGNRLSSYFTFRYILLSEKPLRVYGLFAPFYLPFGSQGDKEDKGQGLLPFFTDEFNFVQLLVRKNAVNNVANFDNDEDFQRIIGDTN